ncbi:MAG TPA: hypothetical protein VF598_01910 [Hymenobacter sp.]
MKVCSTEAVGEHLEAVGEHPEAFGERAEGKVCGPETVGEHPEAAGGAWEAVGGWVELVSSSIGRVARELLLTRALSSQSNDENEHRRT